MVEGSIMTTGQEPHDYGYLELSWGFRGCFFMSDNIRSLFV
ncbi:hypothetical protein [Paenibacillus lautus]